MAPLHEQKAAQRIWPPRGSLHPAELVRLGPAVAVRAECEGVPVYGYGYSYIYGVSPTFAKLIPAQVDAASPWRKLTPKKT